MAKFLKWDSQPLALWTAQHAPGKVIELEGKATHFIEQGQGEPVILLHGFFLDSSCWQRNIDALAERFHVYALDLWSHGYSARDRFDYGYPLFAHQVRVFMDALGIERASLVGHSMGGGTAILMAVQHPDRVSRLLLVDPNGVPNRIPLTGKIFNLPGVGEFLLGLNTNAVRKSLIGGFFVHDKRAISDDCLESLVRHHKIQGTSMGLLALYRREFQDKLAGELRQLAALDIPTLLVWGQIDKAIPLRYGQEMHRILKTARLEVIQDAGHLPNFERPEVFNPLATEFLEARPSPAALGQER